MSTEQQQDIRQISPIIVTAPTARNGVTLVQRLINSTGSAIIYGEENVILDRIPSVISEYAKLNQKREMLESRKQRFLSGDTEFWSSDLNANPEVAMNIAFECLLKLLNAMQIEAKSHGFDRFGIKNPMLYAGMMDRFQMLIPQAQFIFIYRNPIDVVKSAKARKFITSLDDVADYAENWRDGCVEFLSKERPNTLVIQYESLTNGGETEINQIEAFTGLTGVKREVLAKKINTFNGSPAQGMSPTGYIDPATLSEDEEKMIVDKAGTVMQQLGYLPAS